jgi:hypothetical protein
MSFLIPIIILFFLLGGDLLTRFRITRRTAEVVA